MRPARHLVLDNEAAQALLSPARRHPARAAVIEAVAAANGRRLVPTAVRAEAGWRRRDARAADANRLIPDDHVLARDTADRLVELRRAVTSASIIDAAVAVAAEDLGSGDTVVEILTSDLPDLRALTGDVEGRVEVTGI